MISKCLHDEREEEAAFEIKIKMECAIGHFGLGNSGHARVQVLSPHFIIGMIIARVAALKARTQSLIGARTPLFV